MSGLALTSLLFLCFPATVRVMAQSTPAPSLSAFYCSSAALLGSATDICTVKLSTDSPSAVTVALSSNDPAVVLPAAVTLAAHTTSLQFTATASAVLTTQTATLTATIGSSLNFALKLNAATRTLRISSTDISFPYVPVGATASSTLALTSTGTLPITIASAAVSGAAFAVSGAGFPLTLNPWQTATLTVQFHPSASGAAEGLLTLASNSTSGSTATLNLSGTGGVPPLNAFYCSSAAILQSATDICTLKVSAASATPIPVTLNSNNSAVAVPATVTIPANATSLQFPAQAASVTSAQSVTLTAKSGGSSATYTLKLNAATRLVIPSTSSLSFEDVAVNTAATRFVLLTSAGTLPVTLTSASVSSGFSVGGLASPVTLNPGQTLLLAVQSQPTTMGPTNGQLTITSNSTAGSTTNIGLHGTSVIGPGGTNSPSKVFPYTGSPLSQTLLPPRPASAIADGFFGMTIYNLAPNGNYVDAGLTPFPEFVVSALRLWDSSYWAMMEPAEGQWNWIKMDKSIAIAQQNGVKDFIYTFGHVPAWASTNPTDPCTNGSGPGTCSPPDMDAFRTFVTQVVQRYCGVVKYYEPWNEPDNPEFWDGSNSQMLAIAQEVYQIARDPANCGCTDGNCSPNGGANPNQVLLPPVSNIRLPESLAWLSSYLASAGSQYPYADIVAFHGYEFTAPEMLATGTQWQLFQQTLAQHGLSGLPVWDTEASWKLDADLPEQQQASWLMRFHMIQAELGVSRFLWYAYDNCSWGTLWTSPVCSNPESAGGQLTQPGTAYGTVESWMIGANPAQCNVFQNGLWACELQRSEGYDAWMLWSSTGASISVPVPAGLGLTVYRDWQNNVNPLPGTLAVTQMPVLLETTDL